MVTMCRALLLLAWGITFNMTGLAADADASDGAGYAKQLLQRTPPSEDAAEAFYSTLQRDVPDRLQAMSRQNQMEFVSTLVSVVASQKKPQDVEVFGYVVKAILGHSRLDPSVQAQAIVPFLADQETQVVARTYLANIAVVEKSDRTRWIDHAIFIPALAAGRALPELVEFLYDRSGSAAAVWFVANLDLSEAERMRIGGIIALGQGWESAIANRDAKAFPGKLEQAKLLKNWLADQSWIVAQFAKWLLKKYPAWKTLPIEKAAGRVAIPERIQFNIANDQALTDASVVTPVRTAQKTLPRTEPAPRMEGEQPFFWQWTNSVFALLAIVLIFCLVLCFKRRQ